MFDRKQSKKKSPMYQTAHGGREGNLAFFPGNRRESCEKSSKQQ